MNAYSEFEPNKTDSKVAAEATNGVASREPSPNRGASVPEAVAIGADSESQESWRERVGIDRSNQIKLVKISHMRYQHPDLQVITTFLRDFGMHVTKKTDTQRWYRGFGTDQYVYYAQQGPKKFLGGTFEVESYQELEKVIKIPNVKIISNGIEELTDAPGGGHIVTIADPEGFPVNFIYGQTPAPSRTMPGKLVYNDESTKPRVKHFQRFEPGPAEVHKLGHFGLCVHDFNGAMDFYTKYFNIVPSDLLYVPEPASSTGEKGRRTVAMFAHIDRGEDLVDHHTLFLTTLDAGAKSHVHHCSFEVHDFDTQFLGHQWLQRKEYKPVWGIGRHILGSQIFDYWWDPHGNMVEHYADGDLVNGTTPVAYGPAGHEGLAVWGPEVPSAFLD